MGRKIKNNIIVQSIIAADVILVGDFTARDTARIDGVVKGFVHSESTLIIGATAKIEGNIHATNIYIAGEVHGDLIASEKIEVSASGKIYGDIITKSLVIDENAIFQGKCEMNIIQDVKANKKEAVEETLKEAVVNEIPANEVKEEQKEEQKEPKK